MRWMIGRHRPSERREPATGSMMPETLVRWDTGSHLNVSYGADSCHRVASEAEVKVSLDRLGKTRQTGSRCPRCGAKPDCYDHQQ